MTEANPIKKAYKHPFIRQVKKGEPFVGTYYVENVYKKIAKNGKTYSDINLRDRSGNSLTRFWGDVEIVAGNYVDVSANVEEYNGEAQIVLTRIIKVDEPTDKSLFINVSSTKDEDIKTFDVLKQMLAECSEKAKDHTCMNVCNYTFNSDFCNKFFTAPFGISPFYGVAGGLLCHTVRTTVLACDMADTYALNPIEKTVLIGASLLHAVGGVEAYEIKGCMAAETTSGVLMGLNALTLEKVIESIVALPEQKKSMNEDTALRLRHAVSVAFDGTRAMTKEALLLSEVQRIDNVMAESFNSIDKDKNEGSQFTAIDTFTRRRYYKGK